MNEKRSTIRKSPSAYSIITSIKSKKDGSNEPIEAITADLKGRIEEFKRKRPVSGVFPVQKSGVDDLSREDSVGDENADGSRLEMLIERSLGKNYVVFLRSGHPWAKFWVQLKIGIAVIPTDEYMSYIEGILDIKTHSDHYNLYGNQNLRGKFMKKYGFASEDEVVEFLMCELQMAELMPMDEKTKLSS